jgi:probable phosphoglycerate mutase
MTKLILTRHGHVEGIDPERFRGRCDVPLTELGRAQAKAVAARIASLWSPSAIYSSPMGRCVATANEIAVACQAACHVLEELNDIDYGEWQWRTHEEVRKAWPDLFSAWHAVPHLVRLPGGDSLQQLVARTADALRFVISYHGEDKETVVLVGHDSVNRALLLQLLDQPLSAYWRIAQGPCAINEIEIEDRHVRVLRINDRAHLGAVSEIFT